MRSRPTLAQAAALLAALGAVPAMRVPFFPAEIAWALFSVAGWRILAGADGRALLARKALLVLESVAALLALVTLHALSGDAANPLVGLLALLAVLQALALLHRLASPFLTFLVVLLSTCLVAGAAFVRTDLVALAITSAYVVVLVWTLLLFERELSADRGDRKRGAIQRHRVGSMSALPPGATWRTLFWLCGMGFATGLVLYTITPRSLFGGGSGPPDAEDGRAGTAAEADAMLDGDGEGSFTGPDGASKGIRLGDVGEIKRDLTPYFEIQLPRGRRPHLRENTYDRYWEGNWSASAGEGVDPPRTVEPWDRSGWMPLGREEDPVRGYDAVLTFERGGSRRLYLERDPVRVRILRGVAALPTRLVRYDNEQVDSSIAIRPGDRLEMRSVPPVDDPSALASARSDAGTAPRASFLQLPEACDPLREVAEQVVGDERNPYRRARRLMTWLRGPDFAYTLQMPKVDSSRPVVDFVLRKREGHCEYFAASLTLMLRALGHPARIVRGFRDGDRLDERGTWLVRGTHYHAWTEMHFRGLGWIPLDPTPPDNEAVDAGSVTRVARSDLDGDGDPRSWAERFLGYGDAERDAFVAAIGHVLDRLVGAPFRFLFGKDGYFIGLPLLTLGLLLWQRRRHRGRVARRVGVSRTIDLDGPYGRALQLLAKKGFRRRRAHTPREFHRVVMERLPAVRTALASLTRLHEHQRYGGHGLDREQERAAHVNLDALATTLEEVGRPSRRSRHK